ncbi:30S ribosomal protein S6--L-glutamate ligase [Flavobacteriaceae bacterium]|jgi:ribosomal protein S6--L-glutamate ligase|uniref:30S ribosomal protein S6--L-glutamate ligase n=1 Tax=Candidatus Arcticimaribacter forsetii TaxID=2820661 RepID=UPI0020773B62|nr:30S ribosomal protein S6--L-glutamate ligase [Candidatus Arcticimaribacter forsetii]MDA8698879.1 30S ribosomal protein S6--L-glutamate ligase [Flavobacteriaceae bacterium]MDB2325848.1 30S ribosomal protein S6--L-glutamate ligase [Flavobacteriaceae bacterium]MDB2345805.1 30S ribosomal protein S6--L-glutamate ligase [Flavobacteriaceae bacterium]MDB4621025.1 30S ribosomal protein S6--L-glutamate ligase [Flavobacteriaceae bacterium]MDB4674938.1 30S ribosomal protein S6--L-glutamate ligase [Flav
MSLNKIIVGSEEWCGLPQLNIPAIKARVDSGAKTSALHAVNIIPFKKDGDPWVRYEVHPLQNDGKTSIHCESPVIDKRKVKSSSGLSELRYVIKSIISIAESTWEIDLTLTNRDSMGYRMLLGRQAMAGKMLVDPEASFQLGKLTPTLIENYYHIHIKKYSGLKIGLLASNPNLYSNRRIIEAGEEHGHKMEFLNIKDCYIKLDGENPEMHYRGGRILKDFDVIIPRIRPSMTFYGCALTRHFEALGVYTQNNADSIAQSRDKLYSLQLLINSGLPIPTTGFANSPLDTDDLIQMVGGAPLIVKLLEGTQGKGVVLAETKKAAESLINAFKSLRANILVQEFIKEADGKDIRCFVVNGKVVESIMRTAAPGEFRANIHLGGTAQKIKITPTERKIAILAAKTLNLKVAGVDIIRGKNSPLLLEVNSSPGLEGIEGVSTKDIAGTMIEAIEKDLKFRK